MPAMVEGTAHLLSGRNPNADRAGECGCDHCARQDTEGGHTIGALYRPAGRGDCGLSGLRL